MKNDKSLNGEEKNQTSQYLKVLSRVENLLLQKKLPDAAIEGFVGAIRNQIELMAEEEKRMLVTLPEAENLDLKKIENLPELILENIRNQEKLPSLLKFLKLPKFAELMQTDSKNNYKTYSANSSPKTELNKVQEINILDVPQGDKKQTLAVLSNPKKIDI